jgi:hypothetical protein
MSFKHFHGLASTLVILVTASTAAPVIAQQASAILDYVTPVGNGRYNIGGRALAANGQLACGLALASGRCMFTCGPGSLRCEGGTDPDIQFGHFRLFNLPTEANGTIGLQIFIAGNLPFAGTINPGGGGGGTARWTALTNVCCSTGPFTYQVTIDGVTRSSTASSCNSDPSFEGFASTTPGTKSYSSRAFSSACGINSQGGGTVTLASGACYRFALNLQGQNLVESVGTVNCPSSANAETLQEENQATPMAIFPMQPVDPSTLGQERWDLLKGITRP